MQDKILFTCKITAVKQSVYPDLMEQYENPIEHACDIKVGDVFFSRNAEKPEGLCFRCVVHGVPAVFEKAFHFL